VGEAPGARRVISPPIWQVCFVGRKRKAPWDWFLTKGYFHVFALGYLPGTGVWLRYDVSCFKTEIELLSGEDADGLLIWAHEEGGVLTWPAPVPKRSFMPRLGFWCVPAIKNLLGLRCVAATPKGLHDYLARHGATPFVEEAHVPIRVTEATGSP
jgi:hypothetical protein